MIKKIKCLLVIFVVLLMTGCNSASDEVKKELDLDNYKEKVVELNINGETPFSDSSNLNNLDVLDTYGLDSSLLDDYLIYMPSSVVNASMFIVVKPISGQESVVKYQIKELFEKYYNAYNGYYPKEAKLIEDRMEKEVDGYLVYIVSNDNDKVYNLLKESTK